MRVVVYSKPFFPLMGGLERNTLTLCLALKDLGHDVHLFTETCGEDDKDYPFDITRSSVRHLWSVLKGADLFIVNGNVALRAIPFAFLRRIPYAIIYHNYRGYRRTGNGTRTRIENRVRKAAAQGAIANIFTSTHAKERAGLPEHTAGVLLNPVDKQMSPLYEKIERKELSEAQPLLFAGRIIEGKGVFVLMEALSQLDGSMDLQVVFAGEGEAEDELQAQAQRLSSIQVEFVGRLATEELVAAYHQARVLVVPSTTHKEGNPLVIAEALYAGTPVIASDQPPMIESVGEAGIVVEQGQAGQLAEAIQMIYTDDSSYQDLRRSAQRQADAFSYERYRDRLKQVFPLTSRRRSYV